MEGDGGTGQLTAPRLLLSVPGKSLQEVGVSWWLRLLPLSLTSVKDFLQGPYSSTYLPSSTACFPGRAIQSSCWTPYQRWSSILFPNPISQCHCQPVSVSEVAKGTEPVLCDSGGHRVVSGPTLRPQRLTSMCFTRVLPICSATERLPSLGLRPGGREQRWGSSA